MKTDSMRKKTMRGENCRLVSLCGDRDGEVLRMEDSRGAVGPGKEMR